jgi:hypothetical protein
MYMNNLLENYINHCIDDLELPIAQLSEDDKKIYIMYEHQKYTIEVISLLLNIPIKKVENRICKLICQGVSMNLENINFNNSLCISIKEIINKNDNKMNDKQLVSFIKSNLKDKYVDIKKSHIKVALHMIN